MEEEIADGRFGVLSKNGLPLRFDDFSYGQSGDDDPAVALLGVFKNALAGVRPSGLVFGDEGYEVG
jgi:hypothetical protein